MNNNTLMILILVSIGLFYTFIDPQYQKAKVLRVEADQYQHVLSNISAISETRNQLMTKLNDISPRDIDRLGKVLPGGVNVVELARDLDTIGSNYGITLRSIHVETEAASRARTIQQESNNLYEKEAITMTFVSNYENFKRFLSDIERSLRLIDVRSVSFEGVGPSQLYEFRVTFDVYWVN